MSSNRNMRRRTSSASSGLCSSRLSRIVFSVERSTLPSTSTRAFTPPAVVKSWLITLLSLRSSTFSISRITSGAVRSMSARRIATSDCSSAGSELTTCPAVSGGR